MKVSTTDDTRAMYDLAAADYARRMQSDFRLPVYGQKLGKLAGHIEHLDRPVIDSSCGSGHMLSKRRDLDTEDRLAVLREWYRVLKPEGRFLLATWQCGRRIDDGDHSDLGARRYLQDQFGKSERSAAFTTGSVSTEAAEDFDMDPVYIETR